MSWLRFVLCSFLLTVPALGSMGEVADKIYYGGDIITADDTNPYAEAVAVSDGMIVKVGTLADVVRLRGASTELVDLEGRTLAPGFIDAHGHLSRAGLQAVCANLMPPPDGRNTSISAILETLRLWMAEARLPGDSGLVIGYGYSESQFTEERELTRDDLDAVSMNLPVIAIHKSGEKSVFNSRALEIAGIDAATPDPYGGTIGRGFLSDEPNGMLEKRAHDTALAKVLSELGQREFIALIKAGQELYARFGHTTAQDGHTDPGALAAYPQLAAIGRLRIDVVAYPDLLTFADHPVLTGPLHARTYTNGFRIGGVMLRLHGAKREETARLRQSYLRLASGPVRSVTSRAGFDDRKAAALVAIAFRKGWQLLASADGEAATDQFVKAVRAASVQAPGDGRRPVLVLQQSLTTDQEEAIRELNIIPAFPAGDAFAGAGSPGRTGAEAGAQGAFAPVSRLMSVGMIFTAYHDAPATVPNALRVFSQMIRQSEGAPDGVFAGSDLTRLAAFKAITLWAAYQHFEEDRKGSLAAGKLADLVILSANPLTVEADELDKIEVVETVKEGETIYVKPGKTKASEETGSLACVKSEPCFKGMTEALDRAKPMASARKNIARAESSAGRKGK